MAYHPDVTQQMPLSLDMRPLVHVPINRRLTLAERFEQFDRCNPHVYTNLRQLALMMQSCGLRHWSIKAAFEILRFQAAMQTTGDPYKLNNSYHALYSRKLMDEVPRLQGFFELRERKAK